MDQESNVNKKMKKELNLCITGDSNWFEKCYEDFLQSVLYDMMQEKQADMLRRAFIAGYEAAGGRAGERQRAKALKRLME